MYTPLTGAEIRGRYGPDHEVTRFAELAASEILTTAGRVETMLVLALETDGHRQTSAGCEPGASPCFTAPAI